MAKELVTDELWETIEALLPPEPPKPQGGRTRIEDRAAITGAQKPQRIRRTKERRARSVSYFRPKGRTTGGSAHGRKRPRLDGLRRTPRHCRVHQASWQGQAEEASKEAAC